MVKVFLENIFTSSYQITKLFESMFSIRQHAGSRNDRKKRELADQEVNMTCRLTSETVN